MFYNAQEHTVLGLKDLLASTGWRLLRIHSIDPQKYLLKSVEAVPMWRIRIFNPFDYVPYIPWRLLTQTWPGCPPLLIEECRLGLDVGICGLDWAWLRVLSRQTRVAVRVKKRPPRRYLFKSSNFVWTVLILRLLNPAFCAAFFNRWLVLASQLC